MDKRVCRTYLFRIITLTILIGSGCTRQHYFVIESDSIDLYYKNPDAHEVLFASSLDRFTLHSAANIDHGVWRVTVPRRDNFSYFYVVDKVPEIPQCELTVLDDFGGKNCFFALEM